MEVLRIVFAGTPGFAVPALTALLALPAVRVAAVYTQPDRPSGRGRRVTASPVKQLASDHGLALEQPTRISGAAAVERFAAYRPDVLVVAAYGLILPAAFLAVPDAPINVHASLLPRWRGAAPIQRAIMAGDEKTGISIMRIIERLDAGPIWLTRDCAIEPGDTAGVVHDRLAALGAEALTAALSLYREGAIQEQPQDEVAATYAAKLTAADRRIDWAMSARTLARRIWALDPVPGASATLGRVETKLFGAWVEQGVAGAAPGTVVDRGRDAIRVATGEDVLAIGEFQPPGKRRMTAEVFLNGYGAQL